MKTETTSAHIKKENYFFHVFSISTPINSAFFCILISNYLYEIGLLGLINYVIFINLLLSHTHVITLFCQAILIIVHLAKTQTSG